MKTKFLGEFDAIKDKVFEEVEGNVFVFGSNLDGCHGGGAAATAVQKYGAQMGRGEGLMGIKWKNVGNGKFPKWEFDGFKGVNGTLSYALPTKGFDIETLPLVVIDYFVGRLNKAVLNKDNAWATWFVTRVGCGLGGYKDEQISSLFNNYKWPMNVILPRGW